MASRKFARDRHQPPGEWVQATKLESVVGIQFRKNAVIDFSRAVSGAERKGLVYGLLLRHEPDNPHDRNAIAVTGFVEAKGWFRRGMKKWHVGYVPAILAEEIVRDLVAKGIPIAAELYSIFEGLDGFVGIKFFVLAPPGNGVKARMKRS